MTMSGAKKTTAALFLIALMGFAGTADAYPGGNGRGMGRGMGPCQNYQNLTQEQQSAARELFAEHDKTVAPLRQQLFAKQAELDALRYGDAADSAAAQTLFRDIADIKAQLFTAERTLQGKLADKGLNAPGRGMGAGMGYGGGHRGKTHRGYGGYGGHGGHGAGYGPMW